MLGDHVHIRGPIDFEELSRQSLRHEGIEAQEIDVRLALEIDD
jgi:hypothetical protein